MRNALVFFKSVNESFNAEYFEKIIGLFATGNVCIDTVEILSDTDNLGFNRRLEDFINSFDNLIIVTADKPSFNIKEIIANKTETELAINENAMRFVKTVATSEGTEYADDYAVMPIDATVIPNINGAFQGFFKEDKEFSLVVLPSSLKEVQVMCEGYVLPYFESKYGTRPDKLVLKYFGDMQAMDATLNNAVSLSGGKLKTHVSTEYGDSCITLLFDADTDKTKVAEVKRYIVQNLQEGIYAEYNVSLSERLFDALKLKNMRLSVAESFTGGGIASAIISNPGVSEYFNEGVVAYSNRAKTRRLGVKKETLISEGAVSAQVAYQMSAGLLVTDGCDIAISTTGIAGPNSDNTKKPVGLCYIGVGTKTGIHSYKFNFTGSRKEITETAINTAMFLAIKKLKNI